MVDALDDLDLKYPVVANSPELIKVRDALLAEGGKAVSKPKAAKKRKAKA
jgi:hypothetical protein